MSSAKRKNAPICDSCSHLRARRLRDILRLDPDFVLPLLHIHSSASPPDILSFHNERRSRCPGDGGPTSPALFARGHKKSPHLRAFEQNGKIGHQRRAAPERSPPAPCPLGIYCITEGGSERSAAAGSPGPASTFPTGSGSGASQTPSSPSPCPHRGYGSPPPSGSCWWW